MTGVLPLRLPDLAVTLAVYVPAGVPGIVVGGDELPPHASMPNKASAIIGNAKAGMRHR